MEERGIKEEGRVWENTSLQYSCCNYVIYTATMEGRPLRNTFSLTAGLELGGVSGGVVFVAAQFEAEPHTD